MANLTSFTNIWNTVKEVDLRPLKEEALQMVDIAVVGHEGSGRSILADQMRRDPDREDMETRSPVRILTLDEGDRAQESDLIILMLDAAGEDFTREKHLFHRWVDEGKAVLVFARQETWEKESRPRVNWGYRRVVAGPVSDPAFLQTEFAPAVIHLLPGKLSALGRHFPLFRTPVAHHLINETSFANAAYSLSTGLAEIVPVLGIPLNVADMVVLTKAQAFLVYKLGLAFGFSTEWRDYVGEFGSVLGGGFLWRQVARSLVGLIPAWGIIPKVTVAYAGTFVVGNTVLQWYLTGRQISRKQMRQLYQEALARGKNTAQMLVSKMPRPRRRSKVRLLPGRKQKCPDCGGRNAPDARYCQYCGYDLSVNGTPTPQLPSE